MFTKKMIGFRPDEELITMLERIRMGRSLSYQKIIKDCIALKYRTILNNQNSPSV